MNTKKLAVIAFRPGRKFLLTTITIALAFGCHKSNVNPADLRDFTQVNLVANSSEYNPLRIDQSLINAFGIAWSPNGIAWVNSVGGHVSELYNSEGQSVRKAVNIPSPTDPTGGGFPCGVVFSGGLGFQLPNGAANFIFSSFDGVISAWDGGDSAQRTNVPPHASFTGLAIGSSGGKNFIYAANFGQNKIDVWDTAFKKVQMSFVDPTLPAGYSPYNIQAVGNWLFVMYAVLGSDGHPVKGEGKGFVSVFNMDGSFVRRFASQGTLNVPWGVTIAPGSFLEDKDLADGNHGDNNNSTRGNHDSKDPVILVGNFGDGHINVFSEDARFLGQLQSHNHTLVIEGLWALSFPPASANIDARRLYFSAGPDNEMDGVFGYIIKR